MIFQIEESQGGLESRPPSSLQKFHLASDFSCQDPHASQAWEVQTP